MEPYLLWLQTGPAVEALSLKSMRESERIGILGLVSFQPLPFLIYRGLYGRLYVLIFRMYNLLVDSQIGYVVNLGNFCLITASAAGSMEGLSRKPSETSVASTSHPFCGPDMAP